MLGVGAIQRTKIEQEIRAKSNRRTLLAGERFDDLYNHAIKCSDAECKDCRQWEKICEVLLKFWAS
jgi:hypothetical protein